ncbi:endo-1,4-beta-xylanase [Emticicia aquatilis]|uniref:Endo-1,4-beta-xylanase n=1 Tax=Emticicia aquatilis TaxID=1537369 RepID=A0A916YSC5_9BACT|nr:alpha/beta hydrolase-fold protein [Emticicia aquatilis]GGD58872.1 endo-1,4-beta-xylanase [Emticicia aquatilis]
MNSKFFTTEKATFQGLDFITVKSNTLKQRTDITVFTPPNLDESATPLVILLHGVYGSHWAWTMKGNAHITTQKLIETEQIKPMILAMPSDGLYADGSGYVPHQTADYERWIVEDLVEVMKEQYAQITDESPIFISGLSMGGFGALRLGAKYPTVFKAFSGLSSITHFNQIGEFVSDFEQLKQDALEQDGVLEWVLRNNEIIPPFRFDCGTDDILIEYNRQLHLELNNHGITHTYEEFSGGHTWEYWTEHLAETLLFFNKQLV